MPVTGLYCTINACTLLYEALCVQQEAEAEEERQRQMELEKAEVSHRQCTACILFCSAVILFLYPCEYEIIDPIFILQESYYICLSL